MLIDPTCTIVSSFTRGNKMYVTIEMNLGEDTFAPLIGIDIGDFKIEVNRNGGNLTLKLLYNDSKIAEWSIPFPEGCVNLGEKTFEILGIKVKIKDIEICLEGDQVCFKAGVYVKNPITGGYNKIGDINLCS